MPVEHSESHLTALIARQMRGYGFHVWKINQTRAKPRFIMDKGVSDIIAFGHKSIVFVETKLDGNVQSDEQLEFEKWAVENGAKYWLAYRAEDIYQFCRAEGWVK